MIQVQDLMIKDLMEEEKEDQQGNELLELLEFTKQNGVPLTDDQVKGMFFLNEIGMNDIANYAMAIRPELTPTKKFFKLVDKLTLADRIKGNAKLGNLLKANMASPSQNIPSSELQAKKMTMKEIQ